VYRGFCRVFVKLSQLLESIGAFVESLESYLNCSIKGRVYRAKV
jgi:hypothetical protein